MATSIKSGADLLWVYQLRREHNALLEQLKCLEKITAAQQERILANEQHDRSSHDQKLGNLAREVKELQDFDASQQIVVLAREARQEFGRVRDRVKRLELSSRESENSAQKNDSAVQRRYEELDGAVRRLEGNLQGVEGRLELADCPGLRRAIEGARFASDRNDRKIEVLGEQLSGMERSLADLRVLFENLKRDHIGNLVPAVVPTVVHGSVFEDTGETLGHARTPAPALPATAAKNTPTKAKKAAVSDLPRVNAPEVADAIDTANHPRTPSLPPFHQPKKKPSGKAKKNFDKELTQLMHGDGSLTNAQIIPASSDVHFVTRAYRKRKADRNDEAVIGIENQYQPLAIGESNKKRKIEAKAEPSRPLTSHRETRTRRVVKEEPIASRAAFEAISKANNAGFSQAKTTSRRKKEPKRPLPPKWPGLKRPPQIQSSDENQAVALQEPIVSDSSIPPQTAKANSKGNVAHVASNPVPTAQGLDANHEQRPQHRRRRILQDDSTEDFLAKCQAVAEI